MLTIDLMFKNSPLPISVQKKDQEQAQALYQQLLAAMRASTSEVIEMQCEKEPGKTVAVLSDQISAVIMSEKSGSASSGRGPGFFTTVGS
ncbi:hypothetical protein [Gloeocapsa sp. PCC 73106]|uniref:hypothetical protein n=1 Tax=Gloeocapsa sp. PCC 73106 TaxID=102232 RepID=UPI0002AD0DB0|nr:hypothetical protein [Gloeocapsa sp. PCC 73106]ELR99062.1 hypothetical protein GLO73106DRAFT_00029080 [Gloeocapsa sp. PCC 73106]